MKKLFKKWFGGRDGYLPTSSEASALAWELVSMFPEKAVNIEMNVWVHTKYGEFSREIEPKFRIWIDGEVDIEAITFDGLKEKFVVRAK